MKRICLVLIFIVGCSAGATESGQYELSEGSITGPVVITAGGGSPVHVVNEGAYGHTFVVTDEDGRVVAASDIIASGDAIDLDLDLDPGSYLVSCRLITQSPDGTINDHFQLGMFMSIEAH